MDSFINGNMVQKSLPMKPDGYQNKKIAVIENGLFSTYTMRDGLMQTTVKARL